MLIRRRPPRAVVDWKIYNEALVRRGEFLLDLELLGDEEEQLRELNWEKRGRPYRYSEGLIHFAVVLKIAFKLDYRSTQGLLRKILPFLGLQAMDYSTLCERVGKLPRELKVYEPQGEQAVAIDSTGRSQGLRGTYRESTYATPERTFVKLHVSVNTKTRQVQSMAVTVGKAADIRQAPMLLAAARQHGSVRKLYADAAYDGAELRGELAEGGAESAIRLNPQAKPKNIRQATREVQRRLGEDPASDERRRLLGQLDRLRNTEMNAKSFEAWRDRTDYGQRAHVECFFSREVRFFGDAVRSRSLHKAAVELAIRLSLMNLLMRLAQCRSPEELRTYTPESFRGS